MKAKRQLSYSGAFWLFIMRICKRFFYKYVLTCRYAIINDEIKRVERISIEN